MSAVTDITLAAYAMKKPEPDIRRRLGTAVCTEHPNR